MVVQGYQPGTKVPGSKHTFWFIVDEAIGGYEDYGYTQANTSIYFNKVEIS